MLVSLATILAMEEKKGTAVGAFNVPNWESAHGIIQAAEETGEPVVLNYAPIHASFMNMEDAAYIMLHFAEKATVPVCVHLDHGDSFETCINAIRLGFTSVMIDASAKPYEDNIRETGLVVRAAHSVGVSVEAELGHIFVSTTGVGAAPAKIETADSFKNMDTIYTNPEVAKDFVDKTHVDALAVAFGTSHGIYFKKPVLDLPRIKRIREATNGLPLVMHGGSGLNRDEFHTAITNGIRKINYYTYMTLAGGKAVKTFIDKKKDDEQIFFHDIPVVATSAIKDEVVRAIRIFSGNM